jgi:hypothetical protein
VGRGRRLNVWSDALARVCEGHPGLVAVHESPSGRLALVLRHTVVPLPEEHSAWRAETRAAARAVIDELRGAGVTGGFVVAQWLPVQRLGEVFEAWPLRWEGDRARAAQLRAAIRRLLADQRFLAWRHAENRLRPAERGESPSVRRWYCKMAPVWLGIEPEVRRQLVLQTHVWIVERALGREAWPPPIVDLVDDGPLAHRLERLVPAEARERWRPWIETVRTELARALRRRNERRDQRWMRSLFMTACRVPAPVAREVIVSAL